MECRERKELGPSEMVATLIDKWRRIENKLKEASSRRAKRNLKMELCGLKMELAWWLMDCKRHEEALALMSTLPWRTWGEPMCNGISRALAEMGRFDEAKRVLEKGLRRYPESYQLWVGMGVLYGSLGNHLESLKCFETALMFAPEESWEASYNKAIALEKLGSYGDAATVLDDLTKRFPGNPTFILERGCSARELGYPTEALQYYQSAMELWELDPDPVTGVGIYAELCSAYMDLGHKKEAMEVAVKGLKRFPDEDSVLYHNVAATFLEMGWKQEAREVLRKGVEKFPQDEELKNFFKGLEEDMDDPDGGEKPPLLGLLLLTTLIWKKMKRGRRP
jgi:tetratricopeptide (TPR) repeat protein